MLKNGTSTGTWLQSSNIPTGNEINCFLLRATKRSRSFINRVVIERRKSQTLENRACICSSGNINSSVTNFGGTQLCPCILKKCSSLPNLEDVSALEQQDLQATAFVPPDWRARHASSWPQQQRNYTLCNSLNPRNRGQFIGAIKSLCSY